MRSSCWIFVALLLLAGCSGDDPLSSTDDLDPAFVAGTLSAREAATLAQLAATLVATAAIDPVGQKTHDTAGTCLDPIVSNIEERSFTVTLNAGDGCTTQGTTFRGVMTIVVNPLPAAGQISATASFEAFFVNDQRIDGSLSTTLAVAEHVATGTVTADLTVSNSTATTSADADLHVVVHTGGTATLDDDTAEVNGTTTLGYDDSNVIVSAALTIDDATPLTFQSGCPFPLTGHMEADVVTPARSFEGAQVDFSPPGGGCDSVAAITISGFTRTVDLTTLGDV